MSGSILLSTVSNFLDFFKLEAGKALDIVRSSVDLGQLVADVHCIIEAMIGRNGDLALLEPDMKVGEREHGSAAAWRGMQVTRTARRNVLLRENNFPACWPSQQVWCAALH